LNFRVSNGCGAEERGDRREGRDWMRNGVGLDEGWSRIG